MPPLNKLQKSCIALAVGQALVPTNLKAATITVDTPGTTFGCTIYDAFDAANSNSVAGFCTAGSGASNTIVLPSSANFYLDGSENSNEVGLLVSSVITVQGNGSTIRRSIGGEFPVLDKRLIDVSAGANLNLNDLELRDGHLSDGQGNGAAIRVDSATLTTNSVTIYHNVVAGLSSFVAGGGIAADASTININYSGIRSNSSNYIGAGIFAENYSNINIYRSTVKYNSASDSGGAIYATDSPLDIVDSQLRKNSADKYGGAIFSVGDDVTITNSRFSDNVVGGEDGCCSGPLFGGEGGAVFVYDSHLSISISSFNRNFGGEQGSALKIGGSATLAVDQSSFSNNTVIGFNDSKPTDDLTTPGLHFPDKYGNEGNGGAISISSDSGPSHSIVNSTLSNNVAPYGGAILMAGNQLNITNTTIVGGEHSKYGSRYGGEANIEGNAIFAYGDSNITMANTVVGHSVQRRSIFDFEYTDLCAFSESASLTDTTNNFFQDDTCSGGEDGNPRLARVTSFSRSPIKYFDIGVNGNRFVDLPTHDIYIPLFDSPLQNGGDLTICGSSPVNGVDLRGVPHAESHCDIGAIDSRLKNVVVNHTGDDVADGLAVCTLRDALTTAQGGEGGESVAGGGEARPGQTCGYAYDQTAITFDPTVFPSNGQTTITLTDNLPYISQPVSITGPSSNPSALTVMGDGSDRILGAYQANLYMSGMTFSGGERSAGGSGGAMNVYSSVLTLDRMTISDNTAGYAGGGIRLIQTSAYITNSTISDNTVSAPSVSALVSGGGISAEFNSYLIMTGSTVSNNSLSMSGDPDGGEGGGIKLGYGSFAGIANSTVSGNTAIRGGGLLTEAGFAYIINTTVSDNYASYGGGLYLADEIFGKYYDIPSLNYVSNSIISGNTAGTVGNEIANNNGYVELKYSLIGESSETFSEAIESVVPADVNFKYDNILATSTVYGGSANPYSTPLNEIIKPLSNSPSRRTQTHDLVSGSPAIDNANSMHCDSFIIDNKDQLGRARSDGACDIGSVEFDKETFYVIKAANGNVIVFSL